jgi:hypothetical protein
MQTRRVRITIHLLAGLLVVFLASGIDYLLGAPPSWGKSQTLLLLIGLLVMPLGFVPQSMRLAKATTNFSLMLLSFFGVVAICEISFRTIGIDFAHAEEAWRRIPPYFRQPVVPSGEAFFRRLGPEEWTGQVLNTQLKLQHVEPNPYADESPVTVRYNRLGFRAPEDFEDWDVAVAGDSFTELGYLPEEELFTTILARKLGLRVLNLGTSYTGPLTQLNYLKSYGMAKSTRQALIVFFEGNDLSDLDREYQGLRQYRETGRRERREFTKQVSFVRAVNELMHVAEMRAKPPQFVDAYFRSASGDVPVTLTYTPPGRSGLGTDTLQQLEYFFAQYQKFGATRHLRISLAYVPCKTRVLYGHLRFTENTAPRLRDWQPSDLPEVIKELATAHGVEFIDLTPSLVAATAARGELLYNTIFDSHFNARGSAVVAKQLTAVLGPALSAGKTIP